MWNSRERAEKKLDARFLSTLRQKIERKREVVYADPASVENPDVAFERYMERTEWERKQITLLEQRRLLSDLDLYGIIVPPEYMDEDTPTRLILNYQGTLWARRQVRDYKWTRAKDVAAIYSAVLSPLVAVLSLIVSIILALKKR